MKKFIDFHNRTMAKIWDMATSPAKPAPSVIEFLPRTPETELFHKFGDKVASLRNKYNYWGKKILFWMFGVWAFTYLLYLIYMFTL